MATLQTLDRGLKALFFIGASEGGVSVGEIASELGVDRAIAYRVVSTLEENRLVSRLANGRLFLGPGVLRLESKFLPQFRVIAQKRLERLAEQAGATAFLSMAEGKDCVAVVVAEPQDGLIRVGYKVGSRHPLTQGAAGIAILSSRPEEAGDMEEVREARAKGFSLTRGALQKGAVGVASPLARTVRSGRTIEASVGVVAMEDLDVEQARGLVQDCAETINLALGGVEQSA
ncbi:IclR family transcriptional regulator [Mameliella alba]|uniref:Transcriptional regulator n=1 Tax=Mameliella alba TaxID=561184 RepID=A0A0B3S1X5_9RHOB|nr:helix-turn-helix domain-containing protein [Mameliella alba]KHQ50656.1 Transcriptional regulator [Mameliella alba]